MRGKHHLVECTRSMRRRAGCNIQQKLDGDESPTLFSLSRVYFSFRFSRQINTLLAHAMHTTFDTLDGTSSLIMWNAPQANCCLRPATPLGGYSLALCVEPKRSKRFLTHRSPNAKQSPCHSPILNIILKQHAPQRSNVISHLDAQSYTCWLISHVMPTHSFCPTSNLTAV